MAETVFVYKQIALLLTLRALVSCFNANIKTWNIVIIKLGIKEKESKQNWLYTQIDILKKIKE